MIEDRAKFHDQFCNMGIPQIKIRQKKSNSARYVI
jgi:hypothetical protein